MTQVGITEKTNSGLSGAKIAVDLTPMLPGGENGGAKLMTLELISALANLLPETSFMLLTSESSNVELGWLETKHSNIQRMCVLHNNAQTNSFVAAPSYKFSWRIQTFHQLIASVAHILRPELKQRIKAMFLSMANWRSRTFEQLKAFAKYVLPTKHKQRITYRLSATPPETRPKSLLSQIAANLLFCPLTPPSYTAPLIPTVSIIFDLPYRA